MALTPYELSSYIKKGGEKNEEDTMIVLFNQ